MRQLSQNLIRVALVAALAVACGRKQPSACLSPSDSAECFVADFYTWYTVPQARGGPAANSQEALRLRHNAFSPAILSALASDSAERARKSGLALTFDPFTFSKTPCSRYVTGKVENVGTRTRVAIHCMAKYKSPKPSVVAEVFKVDSAFQFTNFLYADTVHPPYTDVFRILAELTPARSATAAPATAPVPDIVGTWRGTSLCVDKQNHPACNDEDAFYEIRPTGQASDSVIVKAQKMVNGAAELVSEDTFTHQADGSWQADIPAPRYRIHVTLRVAGDSLTGTLFSDGQRGRDIALKRSPR